MHDAMPLLEFFFPKKLKNFVGIFTALVIDFFPRVPFCFFFFWKKNGPSSHKIMSIFILFYFS